jgi:hypothetical protein
MPYADPEKNREYHREYNRTWNPEARKKINQKHDRKRWQEPERKQQNTEAKRRRHVRQRVAVIEQYGGQCTFCGCAQFEFLTVDHIDGDGKIHRLELSGKYRTIYDFLYRTEYRPDVFRLLCWNCHMALSLYGVLPGDLHDLAWWKEYAALKRAPNRAAM